MDHVKDYLSTDRLVQLVPQVHLSVKARNGIHEGFHDPGRDMLQKRKRLYRRHQNDTNFEDISSPGKNLTSKAVSAEKVVQIPTEHRSLSSETRGFEESDSSWFICFLFLSHAVSRIAGPS
jgi:hypothetical protein